MPSYCPCCDMNLEPDNRSGGEASLDRYAVHVATCFDNIYAGGPADPGPPISICPRLHQAEVRQAGEDYVNNQQRFKEAGLAPNMTTASWAARMMGRLRAWTNFPFIG